MLINNPRDDLAQRRLARLLSFGSGWDRGDMDTLMAQVADDCVFVASIGPEPGATFAGRDQVRAGFVKLLAHGAGARSSTDASFVAGDRGVALWSLWADDGAGPALITRGCDIFTFQDDLIIRKDAFRKVLG